ncbi:hypothetical protein J19TS2_47540 [Cohnella xylanilytica]|uniref:Di/tricarboxylate transporter n=1 Tax=Cohnella xylanilytica TaxID=557555 RepID=A0A841TZJ1_9BACL|nr:hypothetical protein [Cohnella xylanilytica]MBB6693696.1 hypothetical protein [Cohnella xylanilytica]GIO15199.1 hypothetical protein J19TS2_47540 [Cohnella xylanilytica]
MRIAAKAYDRVLILSLAAIYILLQITRWEFLSDALGVLVLVTVAVLLPRLKGMTRILTACFLIGGALLMTASGAGPREWFEAASVNATVATLFAIAPLFGIPVRSRKYESALLGFYENRLTSPAGFFLGSQFLTMLMGVFINVGSIPVVYHLASVHTRLAKPGMLANALNRGFAGAIFWSPYFAAMALVTTALDLPWTAILPYAIGLSLLSGTVSLLVELPSLRKGAAEEGRRDEGEPRKSGPSEQSAPLAGAGKTLTLLAAYLASAIILVVALEHWTRLPIVLATCAAALIYPFLWCLGTKEMAAYRAAFREHLTVTVPSLRKEITLFLAAGFFSGAIAGTSLGEWIPKVLDAIPLPEAVTLAVLTVALITVTSLIGLHPIVLVTILATGVDPASVGVSPLFLALLLLGSWAISNPVSPASAVNNLLSGLLGKDVFKLAAGNYKYVAVMAVLLPACVLALRL